MKSKTNIEVRRRRKRGRSMLRRCRTYFATFAFFAANIAIPSLVLLLQHLDQFFAPPLLR